MNPLIKIAIEYKIYVEFNPEEVDSASFCRFDQIEVGTKGKSTQDVLTAFFHELAHIVNFRNNDYRTIHHFDYKNYTQDEVKVILKTGLSAEQYTDKVGKELMKKYYPDIAFVENYQKEDVITEYNKHLNNFFKPLLSS